MHLPGYREFFKFKYFNLARVTWKMAFDNCPGSSERIYVDGVTLYRNFIEEASEGPVREGLIDTLLHIDDRRMENFGNEGNAQKEH